MTPGSHKFSLPRVFLLVFAVFLLGACTNPTPLLEVIQDEGELVVATRNSPTTYYQGPEGFAGLEYELVQLFAKHLGVRARFVLPDDFDQILPMVATREVHLAAAGLTVTPLRETLVRFGPSYQEITQQVVYKAGHRRPRKVEDLIGAQLEIVAGSSHEEELRRLSADYPGLHWEATRDLEPSELLFLVNEELIDYTIADSNELALNRRYYSKLAAGFNLTEPQNLAWAFAHAEDDSLYNAMLVFFDRITRNGTLAQLIERYYGYAEKLNFVEARDFRRHVALRLPRYIPFFQKAAQDTGMDWQLLAAIGYQESHWNPKAISPTGVRGIMMLTQATARQLGIAKRTDPEQSILGGARYIRLMERRIPKRVKEPDRLWLALAGYNIGFGHLEDARIITQQQGGDPDKWADVKQHLPLLTQKKWYKQTRYGYARGREPVRYVDNIRGYYDLLKWINRQQDEPDKAKAPYALSIAPAAL